MKITVDSHTLRFQPMEEYFRRSAEAGFKYIEFSQRDDFWPYSSHPTAIDVIFLYVKRLL